MNPLYIWGAIAFWTIVAALVARASRKGLRPGASEYFIGGRRLRGFLSGMTYAATTYSAFMLVGLVGLTYRFGVAALGFEMTYLLFTVFFLLVFAPRFWFAGQMYDLVTPSELLAKRYDSPGVGAATALLGLIMLIPYSAVQLIGAGLLVEGLTGGSIPYMAGVMVMAVIAGITSLWAGMRSVAWTDAVQGVTMLTTAIVVFVVVSFRYFGGLGGFFDTIALDHSELLTIQWDFNFFLGITLPWSFFALTNPQVSQRLFVPDRISSIRRMILYFSVFGLVYTLISTLYGLQAAAIIPGLENPDGAMPALLTTVPIPLALLLFVGIFAAASSTLGSIVLTLSSLFARDVAKTLRPALSEERQTSIGRGAMLLLLLACIGFAYLRPGLITVLSSMASGGLLVAAPAIIGTFFWARGTAAGALASIIVAGIGTAALYISGWYPFGVWPSVWGLAASTAIFVGVSLMTAAPPTAGDFLAKIDAKLAELS